MFGLFKPPKENIINKIPQHAVSNARSIEQYAAGKLNGMNEVQTNHALGFILGVWVTNCAASGAFQLSQRDYDYVLSLARTSLKWLNDEQKEQVIGIVNELAESGLMPRQPE